MYPIYTITTSTYFPLLMYLITSLKKEEKILKNLTVLGYDLHPYQINYLQKLSISVDTTFYKFEKASYLKYAHDLKINLDQIVKQDKFIYIDSDVWVQNPHCFTQLSEFADIYGFGASFLPLGNRVVNFQHLSCEIPYEAYTKSLNTGVMVFNNQMELFNKTREYYKTKKVFSPFVEQLCFEFASFYLGLDKNNLPQEYNYLTGWNKDDIIELKIDGFYVNNKYISIIHNLLGSYNRLQKVFVEGREIKTYLLPDMVKVYQQSKI